MSPPFNLPCHASNSGHRGPLPRLAATPQPTINVVPTSFSARKSALVSSPSIPALTTTSSKSRPNPPLDSHSFPRHSPVLAGRSHPHSARGHTPPPMSTNANGVPCTSGCCNQPSASSAQISPPHAHASLQHGSPRGGPPPAAAGPSHQGSSLSMSPNAGPSLRSPADEVVSAVQNSWSWPYMQQQHQPGYPHGQNGLGLDAVSRASDSRARGVYHEAPPVRHPLGYQPQIPSGTSGRGKTRYGDAPGASDMPASSATLGRGKASANASTAEDSERRHCCPHCNKRFNRPSSLAIHVNTHTGAKRTCRSWRSTETGY